MLLILTENRKLKTENHPPCSWRAYRLLIPVVLRLFLLLVILAATGCGVQQLTKGELKPPKVSLKAVGLQTPNKNGWPLTCVLALENPNPMTLRALGYDYEVHLEGRSVAQGASSQPVTLPAQGEALVEVPVLVKLQALPALLPRLLAHEKLTYEIAGGLRLPQTLGFRVPFHFKGKLTAEEGMERLRPFLDKQF